LARVELGASTFPKEHRARVLSLTGILPIEMNFVPLAASATPQQHLGFETRILL